MNLLKLCAQCIIRCIGILSWDISFGSSSYFESVTQSCIHNAVLVLCFCAAGISLA